MIVLTRTNNHPVSVDCVTPELINNYGGRKKKGRLDFVVDVSTQKYYPVPRDEEHKDFVPLIPCSNDSELVPFWLLVEKENGAYVVRRVCIGASSYECTHRVRHSGKELEAARALAYNLISASPCLENRVEDCTVSRHYQSDRWHR